MPKLADLYKDLDFLSETVSTRTRTLDGIVIAVWWATMVGGKEAVNGLAAAPLLLPALIAALSLVFDFLQYAVVFVGEAGLLRRLERAKKTEFEFNRHGVTYKIRDACFYLKQVLMAVALIWLIVALAGTML